MDHTNRLAYSAFIPFFPQRTANTFYLPVKTDFNSWVLFKGIEDDIHLIIVQ